MTPTALLDLIKKHGALGVLAIWLFYTNERLNKVEQELSEVCHEIIAILDKYLIPNAKDAEPKVKF